MESPLRQRVIGVKSMKKVNPIRHDESILDALRLGQGTVDADDMRKLSHQDHNPRAIALKIFAFVECNVDTVAPIREQKNFEAIKSPRGVVAAL